MRKFKNEHNFPYLGLLNFEGDAVRAYKKPKSENFIIVDDHMMIIAEWNRLQLFEFTQGKFPVITSYGKSFTYTLEHENAKPAADKLANFIGVVDAPADGKKGQYVIIDLRNMDFMKDKYGKINFYDTEDDACCTCGMYEFENAWVMKLIYNHIEAE